MYSSGLLVEKNCFSKFSISFWEISRVNNLESGRDKQVLQCSTDDP